MKSLLDINLLIALLDAAHVHHQRAHAWFGRNRSLGWATCPITQNGCLRIMSQPQYPGHRSVAEIAHRLRTALSAREHVFWPDSISLTEPKRFAPEKILSSRLVTDVYLLALAKKMGGRLATFDRSIQLDAVAGAQARHLIVI